MNNTVLAIAIHDAKGAAAGLTGFDAIARAAMKAAKNFWLDTNEELRFQGAVGAIYELSDTETRERIEHELKCLHSISAMASGVPVNFEGMMDEDKPKPLGLMKLWHEVEP